MKGTTIHHHPVRQRTSAEKRQTTYLVLIAGVAAGLVCTLIIYGWDYYLLDLGERPYSMKHHSLRPSGTIGLRLGVVSFFMFVIVFLYPLRKHWRLLGRIGKTRNWFNLHILFGLIAPAVVTLHSAFKVQGFAGMAYWAMIALVVSGIIGRYFYAQIPRNIHAAEMSLKEMQDLKAQLVAELRSQGRFKGDGIEQLFCLPDSRAIQSMSLMKSIGTMLALDMTRLFNVWALRRSGLKAEGRSSLTGGVLSTRHRELEHAIRLASDQAALARQILFLSKTHTIFHWWHVIHRPFSISFGILVLIHVGVMTWLGYL